MSIAPSDCPPSATLEGIALGGTVAPEVREHLARCEACLRTLERIQDDNRMLLSFAAGRALAGDAAGGAVPGEIEVPGYEIVREIHRGGQGVVYQAVQRSTKRDVAIKVMKQGPFATLADRVRFEREIETLGRLDHPNVVTVFDAGVAAGAHFFVMNYVDGLPLDEHVDQRRRATGPGAEHPRPLDPRQTVGDTLRMFAKVCDAVHAAHLRGVIHRDLKPSNIRVDRAGEPHVLDFGLAKSSGALADSAMTRTGQFVGSLPWASPEQVEGAVAKIDLRTDVYSLGAMLYQLLAGAPPFDVGSNLRDVFDDILAREPRAPSAAARESGAARLDDELDTIVLRCLAKDRERRYQTAGELSRDLHRYLTGEPIEAKRDSAVYVLRKTLRRYRWQVASAATFVVLLAVFSVVMALLYRRSSRLEQAASESASSLAALLSQNNIEQGRMAGMLGNLEQAERLLWRELLTHREPGADSLRLNDPPGPADARWALWELYRRFPCVRTLTPDPPSGRTLAVAPDGISLWTVGTRGDAERLDFVGRQLETRPLPADREGFLPVVDARGDCLLSRQGRRWLWQTGVADATPMPLDGRGRYDSGEISLSLDGRRVAALVDGAAVVTETRPPYAQTRFPGSHTALALSADARRLAARDDRGCVWLWDVDRQQRIATSAAVAPPRENAHQMGELRFSPDGLRVADAWVEIPGRILDFSHDPPREVELSERPGEYRVQCFSPDGRLLAVGDLGGTLRVFDSHSGRRLTAFGAHPGCVRSVSFTPDGAGVWTSGDGDLRLWGVDPAAGVGVSRFEREFLHSVDVSPDGRWLVAGGTAGILRSGPTGGATLRGDAVDGDATVSSVAISRDGRRVAAATYSNLAFVWDAGRLNEPPAARLPHPNRVSFICFSPDSRQAATACDDGVVRWWDATDGSLLRTLRAADVRLPEITFDADGKRLAVAARDGSLRILELPDGAAQTWAIPRGVPLRSVRFSRDGQWLVCAGAERVIELWDARQGRRVAALVGHNQEVYCLDLSPDSEVAASGDAGGSIRLWHLPTRCLLATLDGHEGAVMAVRFSPDGNRLVSAALDGTLREWDLTYFERHVAGQVSTQLRRMTIGTEDRGRAAAWLAWAEERLAGGT